MDEKFLKLTNTVYKTLEFFPEADPLKTRAKDKALAIMEHLFLINQTQHPPAGRQGWATLADTFSEGKLKALILEDIDILLGYLWIGKTQGWLNSVNCMIINSEYEKIRKELAPRIESTQKLPGLENMAIETAEQAPALENIREISERQQKIIEFLQKNEKAQVMDLQTVLPDITKRTIRRDIDELLEAGKIERQGDFNQVFYRLKGPA